MPLPTVTDLKKHINIPASNTTDDAELAEVLDAAVDVVVGIVGSIDAPEAVTETHYRVNSNVLGLRRGPVVALTAVSAQAGVTATPLPLADYYLDADTGLVRPVARVRFYGDFTVTYTAGRADLPASIRLAILIIAAHLWETQRGTAPTPLSPEPFEAGPVGLGYAIPNRARELLAPYVTPSIA